jgi:hypothetical protein
MNTNKKFLLLTLLSGIFCAFSAIAEVAEPEAYIKLTAVELAPENAPRLTVGMNDLSRFEAKYQEKLPLQLSGAISKVKKAKYQPKN